MMRTTSTHKRWAAMLMPGALVMVAACDAGNPAGPVEQPADEVPADANAQTNEAAGPAAKAVAFEQETDAYEFSYGWPARISAIPPLADRLARERDESLAELKQEAEAWQQEGEERGFSAPRYAYAKDWQVVTDLPRFLSLSAEVYSYSGGAHGMSVSDALIWDREAGKALKPAALFLSDGAIDRAVQTRFCDELDRQRERKRGAPVVRSDDGFNDCIAPSANGTLILGSSSGEAFDRIGFLVPPYNAGPYAEGGYEVTLPVDAALIDAVKPEYQRFFTPAP